jgi:hypothetical protein
LYDKEGEEQICSWSEVIPRICTLSEEERKCEKLEGDEGERKRISIYKTHFSEQKCDITGIKET